MRSLKNEEMEQVLRWLNGFEFLKSRKVINRDFSDAVLVAQILKQLYPKLVELHNYPARNSLTLKLDNWITLNRKVLCKLDMRKSRSVLERFCQAESGAIESLFFEVMQKHQADMDRDELLIKSNGGDADINESDQIMHVNVERKSLDGTMEQVLQPMVTLALYEQSRCTVNEQSQAIAILTQKIEHLDNLLKLKCQRIDDLLSQLARKSRRLKLEEGNGSVTDMLNLKFN